jgi:hypothetical protein
VVAGTAEPHATMSQVATQVAAILTALWCACGRPAALAPAEPGGCAKGIALQYGPVLYVDRRKSRGADRNLGYLPLPDRNLEWIRQNLFRHTNDRGLGGLSMDTVLSDEDDDGC